MKLSEAIRKGATYAPQAFDTYVETNGATCALGAAYQGVKGNTATNTDVVGEIWEVFPQLATEIDVRGDLFAVITFMNDKEHKSREEIADWLAQQGY